MHTATTETNGNGHTPAPVPVIVQPTFSLVRSAYSVQEMNEQIQLIQHQMKEHMKPGEHYGWLPHQNPEKDKPSLFKAGAEKLGFIFQLRPVYDWTDLSLPNGHQQFRGTCDLFHIPSGLWIGQGVGLCTTMEGKYRFRNADRLCPQCGKETILKSKHPGRDGSAPGWYCWQKKGGCGATFPAGAKEIEEQLSGKVEHDNPADYFNTALKMAKKRAHVDAILTATAASDIFTQDIEDMPEVMPKGTAPEAIVVVDAREKPETLRGGTHPTADANGKPAAKRAPKAAPAPRPEDISQEELPEPLPNPWLHRIECVRGVSSLEKGKYIFQVPEAWIIKYPSAEFRNRLTPADLSNIAHCYRRPELREDAIRQVELEREDGIGADDDYNGREVA